MTDRFTEIRDRATAAAPKPTIDDITATTWLRHIATTAYTALDRAHNGPAERIARELRVATGGYTAAGLLVALQEHAPEAVDEIVRDIVGALDAGDIGEDLWAMATATGVDMTVVMGDTDD